MPEVGLSDLPASGMNDSSSFLFPRGEILHRHLSTIDEIDKQAPVGEELVKVC